MLLLQFQFILVATIRNQMGQTNEILGAIRKEQSLVKHNRNLHEQKKRIQTTGLYKGISGPFNQVICRVYCCWIRPFFILRMLSYAELDLVPTNIKNHCIHFPSFDWIIQQYNTHTLFRIKRYEVIMKSYPHYRPLSWTECLIKLMHYYGTQIKFITIAATGDIEKLSMICQKHKLNFRCRVFEEYLILLTKVDIDSSKNDLVRNKNRL